MKITLARSAGFCFGVRRAIDIAFKTVGSGSPVYMLGDIVHNETVVKAIRDAGVKKIRRLGNGKGKILLIRAHGARISTIEKAIKQGYDIVDATCPMVKEIHRIVSRMEDKGYRVIIAGDKNHDEVKGIIGQLKKKAVVIEPGKDLPKKKLAQLKKAILVVQSTQNTETVEALAAQLKEMIPDFSFYNTICQPTRTKQREIRTLPLENDAVIVIGSRTSANTRRLFEISRSLNKKTYMIEKKGDLKPEWLKGIRSIAVTAGASTPDRITDEVVEYLKKK